MATCSYKALHMKLGAYLKNRARKKYTIRKNKGNLTNLLSKKAHEAMLGRLESRGEVTATKYDGALIKTLVKGLDTILRDNVSTSTKYSYYATVGNVLKSRGYREEQIERLLPRLKDYSVERKPKIFTPINQSEYWSVQRTIKKVVDAKKSDFQSYLAIRDLTIFDVMYHTGARSREIVNLKEKDIDFERRIIKLTDTDKKTRMIPAKKSTLNKLKTFIEFYKENPIGRTSTKRRTLFKNKDGGKLSTRSLRRIFEWWMEEAELKPARQEVLNLMSFRDAYAAYLVRRKEEPESFMKLLGFIDAQNSKKTYQLIKNKLKTKAA